MANAAQSILLPFLFLAVSGLALLPVIEVSSQREFDYFNLALQWPGTYCQRTRHCCAKNGCCRSDPLVEFTIHGLWPDYSDGSWPACCSNSEFDVKKISSLLPLLEKYWPSLSCSSSSLCHGGKGLFWAHEWEKHGTCSYPVIQDEYSYFSTALDLYLKYNITSILNDAGFLASDADKYLVKDIVSAIEGAIGASPKLVCKRGALEELQICFSKDFKPRDCLTGSGLYGSLIAKSSCPNSVSLPSYSPLGIEDGDAKVTLLDIEEIVGPFPVY